jgi:membrane fusion protein (multidrug efflux system)
MKAKFNVILLAAIVLILAACGGAVSKADQLTELKKQQAALADQIRQLETEIELSDSSGTQNRKIKDVKVTKMVSGTFRHFIEIQGNVDTDDNVTVSCTNTGYRYSSFGGAGSNRFCRSTSGKIGRWYLFKTAGGLSNSICFIDRCL